MKQEVLNKILEQHKLWVTSRESEGERANLKNANLKGADLSDTDLSDAILMNTNLMNANLSGASLRDADFYNANLTGANLTGANLEDADFYWASLSGAKIDHNIRNCYQFRFATFSPDALPWLILHLQWAEDKHTLTIVSESEESVIPCHAALRRLATSGLPSLATEDQNTLNDEHLVWLE